MDMDDMYLEGNNNGEFAEEMMETEPDMDDDNEEDTVEHGRCGICTDVVIDRGILDGCDHWFCFSCIDYWATVTNRCPLCENEFQLIKCLPVYDTTGGIKLENCSVSRDDDDWTVQENNNTLSFPSYYIDEGAVVCLDGDGCQVRGGLCNEDSLIYDTSIACDSCDIWYHAFCVGYNPDSASDGSWLCPRCITIEEQQRLDSSLTNKQDSYFPNGLEQGLAINPFLGKVSVSVADDGETALVVSMIQEETVDEDNHIILKNGLQTGSAEDSQASLPDAVVSLPMVDAQVKMRGISEAKFSLLASASADISNSSETPNASVSFCGKSSVSDLIHQNELIQGSSDLVFVEETKSDMIVYSPINDSSGATLDLREDIPSYTPSLVVHEADGTNVSNLSKTNDDSCKDSDKSQDINLLSQNNWETKTQDEVSVVSLSDSTSGKTVGNASVVVTTLNNENAENFILNSWGGDLGNNQKRRKEESEKNLQDTAKKVKFERKHPVVQSGSQIGDADSSKSNSKASSKSETLDIMSIVRGTDKPHTILAEEGPLNKMAENGKGFSGLRVRKIMRRAGDKKEMSQLLQSLGKEIKNVIQDNCNSSEKNKESDRKLLTAFREAMLKTRDETTTKVDPSLLKLRKKLLQKGKTRENLTRKIYATSNGKRRRAWDRDREIEFWKYRCSNTKVEKIETLQSVLECLRKATNSSAEKHEKDEGPNGEAADSILSRVYLADVSVFPRNDNIKPLSTMAISSDVQTVPKRNVSNPLSSIEGNRSSTSSFPREASLRIGNVKVQKTERGVSALDSDKSVQNMKEPAKLPIETKSDKKKWALEVLARKNASATSSVATDKEDGDIIKGNYPLLAQLPKDMRPVAAPIRHNKVPASVRQAQLFRLTEHYLKRTNLAAMVITADTELAVVDAVNVEKEICEKSSSKMVYMNLCAQFLSQAKPNTDVASTNNNQATSRTKPDTGCAEEQLLDIDAEEALKLAGLSSDSPPNSPVKHMQVNADACSMGNNEPEGAENVLDIDNSIDTNSGSVCVSPFDVKANPLNPSNLNSQNILESDKLNNNCDNCSRKPESSEKSVVINLDKSLVNTSSHCLCLHENQTLCETGNDTIGFGMKAQSIQISQGEKLNVPTLGTSELCGSEKESFLEDMSMRPSGGTGGVLEVELSAYNKDTETNEISNSKDVSKEIEEIQCFVQPVKCKSSSKDASPAHSVVHIQEEMPNTDSASSVFRKVEAYVKEHIRPLCKIGVITVEQYRWAVKRTADKVMGYHRKAKDASFLIKEGEKVKKLADQYVEISQKKDVALS